MKLGMKFLKPKDYQTGDTIKFLDEGTWSESQFTYDDGNPKKVLQFRVEDSNGDERLFNLNKINREFLIDNWGYETKDWIGKTATLNVKIAEVAGREREVIRLTV